MGPDGAAPIGLAVSGGGDSMAMLHLAARVPGALARLAVVTVDHGLRAQAAAEAAQVGAFCRGLGLSHDTLRWSGPAPTGNLMDQARHARMALMADWARARGISRVMLGHTADDVAESFLMNLGRRAGLDGLSGMRSDWSLYGVAWHRPLLGATRARLRDYLRHHGVPWVDDPTNDDDHFARVRARQALAALQPLGISAEGLALTAQHLAHSRDALRRMVAETVAAQVTEVCGSLQLAQAAFGAMHPDVRRRFVIAAVRWMGGAAYAPREAQVETLIAALMQGKDAMLGGCRFRQRGGQITVAREGRAAAGQVAVGAIWDHRWRVDGPDAPDIGVAALGPLGLRQVPGWRNLGVARDILAVTPAVWQGDTVLAAPLAGLSNGWSATMTASFGLFLISH